MSSELNQSGELLLLSVARTSFLCFQSNNRESRTKERGSGTFAVPVILILQRKVLMWSKNPLEVHALVVAIAQEGSFVRAARKLGVTQPTLSRQVQMLETNVGVRLFERTSRRVELTQAGRLFVQESTRSLSYAERAWDLARHQSRLEHGPYRIGYSPYVHSAFLPLLSDLSQNLHIPDNDPMAVVLESAPTRELAERVLRGRLNAALCIQPVEDDELWIRPLSREGFSVCVPRNHRLAQKPTITVPDLDGEILFWLPQSVHPDFYRETIGYLKDVGATPVFKEVRNAMHALDFVSHGFGLSLLPRSAAHISRLGVVFKPLADKYLGIETVFLVRRNERHGKLRESIDDLLAKLLALKVKVN